MRTWTTALLLMLTLAGVAAAAPLPWREAGLTPRQAAAHLLDRFAYGARPGEVDRVAALGPDRWVEQQLVGVPDTALERDLRRFDALFMSSREILAEFPPPGMVLGEAVRAGVVERRGAEGAEAADRESARGEIRRYAREQGYRSQRELLAQLGGQRLWRALESENQLREVLVDFWSNYFNVALQDRQARPFLLSYERDAIRPRVLGPFRELLEATAKHPAMLLYLDNAQSVAADTPQTDGLPAGRARRRTGEDGEARPRRARGLNENYARELLELHTLGVDGGYTQQDVVDVARAFTGWSLVPPRLLREGGDPGRLLGSSRPGGRGAGGRSGFGADRFRGPRGGGEARLQIEGDFLFRPAAHDQGAKTVLGHRLPAGRGIEDGEEVLDVLAAHPSTARRVANALAVRFVADQPPATLVERLAEVFRSSGGSTSATLRALAEAPEFWAEAKRKSKIKTPFELVASALRALDARLSSDGGRDGALAWLYRLGHLPFGYQAPTGYPDRADYWVSSGALVERMNFGLAVAAGAVSDAEVDLQALAGGAAPRTPEQALDFYAPRLLPERDLGTVSQMREMARDPDLARRLAATGDSPPAAARDPEIGDLLEWRWGSGPAVTAPPSPVAQVVGVILGSPEFQRR